MAEVEIDLKKVEEKVSKGEEITPEEKRAIMETPAEGSEDRIVTEDRDEFAEIEDIDIPEKGDKPIERKKEVKTEVKVEQKEDKKEPEKIDVPSMEKVEKELEKSPGLEDLKGFSSVEKGLFWNLRKERQKRQAAELERDTLKFRDVKKDIDKKEPENEDDLDFLNNDDEDDFITVKQARELAKRLKGKKESSAEIKPVVPPETIMAWNDAANKNHDDYYEVIECAKEIVHDNAYYLQELAKASQEGRNAAEVMYSLIKGDEKFDKVLPLAKSRLEARGYKRASAQNQEGAAPANAEKTPEEKAKEKNAQAVEKRIEENAQKPKTSAHVSGSAGAEEGDTLTAEKVARMSDAEFASLPKWKRDLILKKFGS